MFANKTYKQQFIMKPSTIVCLVLSANFLVSCGYKKEAKEVTQDFFSAIKNNKEEKWLNYILKLETFKTIINQTQ